MKRKDRHVPVATDYIDYGIEHGIKSCAGIGECNVFNNMNESERMEEELCIKRISFKTKTFETY